MRTLKVHGRSNPLPGIAVLDLSITDKGRTDRYRVSFTSTGCTWSHADEAKRVYRVANGRCTCKGFHVYKTCRHVAATEKICNPS